VKGATCISLAMADGARKDTLRWVTHGTDGDIVDLSTSCPGTRSARRSREMSRPVPSRARHPPTPGMNSNVVR
jgi:hypothetical protein